MSTTPKTVRERAEEIIDDGPNTFGSIERAGYIKLIEQALRETVGEALDRAAEVAGETIGSMRVVCECDCKRGKTFKEIEFKLSGAKDSVLKLKQDYSND